MKKKKRKKTKILNDLIKIKNNFVIFFFKYFFCTEGNTLVYIFKRTAFYGRWDNYALLGAVYEYINQNY